MEFFWTTVAAVLTLCVFSFLYRDNPLYKFVEHLFVGIAAGYVLAVQFHNVFVPNIWHPLVSGEADSAKRAGHSVCGRVISEEDAGPLVHHLIDWVD